MIIHATHSVGKSKIVVAETSTHSNGCRFMNPGAIRVVKLPADRDYTHSSRKGAEVIFSGTVNLRSNGPKSGYHKTLQEALGVAAKEAGVPFQAQEAPAAKAQKTFSM